MKINFSPKTITKMENTTLKLCKCALVASGLVLAGHLQNHYQKAFEKAEKAELLSQQLAIEKKENIMKMDSIAQTNYVLGMQAVRDSLTNANKK